VANCCEHGDEHLGSKKGKSDFLSPKELLGSASTAVCVEWLGEERSL
jgi:hypothetical protein